MGRGFATRFSTSHKYCLCCQGVVCTQHPLELWQIWKCRNPARNERIKGQGESVEQSQGPRRSKIRAAFSSHSAPAYSPPPPIHQAPQDVNSSIWRPLASALPRLQAAGHTAVPTALAGGLVLLSLWVSPKEVHFASFPAC